MFDEVGQAMHQSLVDFLSLIGVTTKDGVFALFLTILAISTIAAIFMSFHDHK